MQKPLFSCDLEYLSSPHLTQLYAGFQTLQKKGLIKLGYSTRRKNKGNKPVITAKINGRVVMYDTLDGLKWINGTIEENLYHFHNNTKADFYFKRSFNSQVAAAAPAGCKVFPLGFNYMVRDNLHLRMGAKEFAKEMLLQKNRISAEAFEALPITGDRFRILFLTRLWDPEEAMLDHIKADREKVNHGRVAALNACKKEFSEYFTGGLLQDSFSIKHQKHLTVPTKFTSRKSFLQQVKSHPVCIATAGLHGSLGWKFGEYVAASRAIITEPMDYEVPGNFISPVNYLSFTNETELLENIYLLIKNPSELQRMMVANWRYYNIYLKPEQLILNTLLQVANA